MIKPHFSETFPATFCHWITHKHTYKNNFGKNFLTRTCHLRVDTRGCVSQLRGSTSCKPSHSSSIEFRPQPSSRPCFLIFGMLQKAIGLVVMQQTGKAHAANRASPGPYGYTHLLDIKSIYMVNPTCKPE